ncbi:hypothetical protein EJ02DRAFT_431479 [Clathrospora elynae]|uniref:Uncharacterized protein n=1 Tax=Clathrospora elynae TaxID=706981 RepID=A0A6A5T125_9PLEO|nr:hypothetical protein EJ02DRAFT_431479 [Clathrospora elynae]
MSNNEGTKTVKRWTNRQRLAYFFNLVDFSNVKLDYTNAPRPNGKSVGACQTMVHRLKGTLKADFEVLRGGQPAEEDSTPKKAVAIPHKRKANGDVDDEGEATPTKRGRKKSAEIVEFAEFDAEDEKLLSIKPEPSDEELDTDAVI